MLPFRYSTAGLKLTEAFEGLRLKAYPDVRGILTIGYGHTGSDVHLGLVITQARAEQLLANDILTAATFVDRAVANTKTTQAQFDAMVDFCFNVGCGAFAGSDLLKLVNAGNMLAAADEFLRWEKAGGRVFDGLVRRRTSERAMFLA